MPDNSTPKRFDLRKLTELAGLFQFIRPYRRQFILGLVLLFFSSSVFMVFPTLIGWMVDIAQGNAPFGLTLGNIGWLLGGILIFQGMVGYGRVMMFARVSESGTADIRTALYQKLVALPVVFFEKSRVGELVSRVTADVEKLYNTFNFVIAEFIRQIIVLVVGIALLALQYPKMALVMLATFPVIVVGAMIFGKRIRKMSKKRQDSLAESNTILDETLQSILAVKAFSNERFEVSRFSKSNAGVVDVAMRYASGRAIFSVFIITVLFGGLFFIIWYGATLLKTGAITAGDLLSFGVYTAIIGGAIAGLGNFYTELVGAVGATDRVREILAMQTESEAIVRKNENAGRFSGDIVFEKIHFSYPTRPDVEVLKGIHFSIKKGQKVALVGQSGAGKSTIMQLLLQFHAPTSGQILIDGKPQHDFSLESFRANFALVPQEVMLFGGTIRENILYGKPAATEAEILDAARQANALEFINAFPEGLETIVGERGVKLSGGQRQRIAIARAILRDPSILLLDEATSALDAESEKVVQEALARLMQNRTSIIIAHRLATIREVDQIFVIEGGRIVEQGTHDDLSARENGAYSSLAKLQFDQN